MLPLAPIGTVFTLTSPWTFLLPLDNKNLRFAQDLGYPHLELRDKNYLGNLPVGTLLTLRRVSLQARETHYCSVAFQCNVGVPGIKGRFWVKLPATYEMECDYDDQPLRRMARVEALTRDDIMEAAKVAFQKCQVEMAAYLNAGGHSRYSYWRVHNRVCRLDDKYAWGVTGRGIEAFAVVVTGPDDDRIEEVFFLDEEAPVTRKAYLRQGDYTDHTIAYWTP